MPSNGDQDHPVANDDVAEDCFEVMAFNHILSTCESIDGQRTPPVGTDHTSISIPPPFQYLPCLLSDYEIWELGDGHGEIYEVEQQFQRRLFDWRIVFNQDLRRTRHFDAI